METKSENHLDISKNIPSNIRIHGPMKVCVLFISELQRNKNVISWFRSYTCWAIISVMWHGNQTYPDIILTYTAISDKVVLVIVKQKNKNWIQFLSKWLVSMCKFTHFQFDTKWCKNIFKKIFCGIDCTYVA